MAERPMTKARQALINMREGMRYTYDDIRINGAIPVSNTILCRIYKGASTARPEIEKALIQMHNDLCKRGEKIK